jgi:hypothetical protein
MYQSNYYESDYYASAYYRAQDGDFTGFDKLSTRDVQYEALKIVSSRSSDTRTMEREYWFGLFGGNANWSTLDIMNDGIVVAGGYSTLKDYYDAITGTVWPDHNSSEKAYWLKVIIDNT